MENRVRLIAKTIGLAAAMLVILAGTAVSFEMLIHPFVIASAVGVVIATAYVVFVLCCTKDPTLK